MRAMGVHDQITSAFQDIVAPELHALRARIGGLDTKLGALDIRERLAALEARRPA